MPILIGIGILLLAFVGLFLGFKSWEASCYEDEQ